MRAADAWWSELVTVNVGRAAPALDEEPQAGRQAAVGVKEHVDRLAVDVARVGEIEHDRAGAANRLGEARPRGVGKGGTASCTWTATRRAKAESTERCRWLFSGDETTDVGSDRATPVSDNYAGRRTVRPTGRVNWVVQIDIDEAAEDHDHLIAAEERLRIAMARQGTREVRTVRASAATEPWRSRRRAVTRRPVTSPILTRSMITLLEFTADQGDAAMPLLDLFWTMLWFFLFIAWIWLLISVFADIFRSRDLSGWGKALWALFVIVVPWLGVLVYLIARGKAMGERDYQEAIERDKATRQYIQTVASTSGASTADELAKLAELRNTGVITEQEFDTQKAKLLAQA